MKKRSLRFRVLYGIIVMNAFFIIVSASIILTSMWINSEKNARELSSALISEIQSSISNRTFNYFSPAGEINQTMAFLLYRYFEDPVNNRNNQEQMFDYYNQLLKIYPQFKMIYYADTEGDLVMLNRMNDGSFSQRRVRNTGTEVQIRWDHANPSLFSSYPNTDEPAASGYDPRKRSWYLEAEEKRELIWTPVYLFATDHLPGFTCATPVFDSFGNITGVSSIDIAVSKLSLFLGTIKPTPGTKIFILDRQDNLVALQAQTETDLEKLFEKTTDANGNDVYYVTSLEDFSDESSRYILKQTPEKSGLSTLVGYQSKKYVSTLAPFAVGNGLDLSIGIIIPEDDIVGNVRKNLKHVTLFSVLVLLLILAASAFLSQAIAGPMRKLSKEMAKIKTLDLDSDVNIDTGLLEVLEMSESFESMRSGLKNFKRYVPSDLVTHLISEKINADLGGVERELTIFFSDIAKFTSISEKTPPAKLLMDLCTYFEIVSKTILQNRGTIDKYIGDSVMAFWGAPVAMEDHAVNACRAAIFIRNELHTLYRHWNNQGKIPFATRMGIHTGEVIVGNMGYNERLNYTVIGDTVNVASRLEGLNKVYNTDIIVSQYTRAQCVDSFEFRHLDRVSVIGRKEPLDIYELISMKDDIDATIKNINRYYESGLQCYFDQHWDGALKYFGAILKAKPDNTPAKRMFDRCVQYKKVPPPSGWNGVFDQPFK